MSDRVDPSTSNADSPAELGPDPGSLRARWRAEIRDVALRTALGKRAAGVPTYSVPEAAALLSVSQEHLYRLVRAGAFPVVRMRVGGDQGRYVIPARAVERLLEVAADGGGCVEVADLASEWRVETGRAGRAGNGGLG